MPINMYCRQPRECSSLIARLDHALCRPLSASLSHHLIQDPRPRGTSVHVVMEVAAARLEKASFVVHAQNILALLVLVRHHNLEHSLELFFVQNETVLCRPHRFRKHACSPPAGTPASTPRVTICYCGQAVHLNKSRQQCWRLLLAADMRCNHGFDTQCRATKGNCRLLEGCPWEAQESFDNDTIQGHKRKLPSAWNAVNPGKDNRTCHDTI